MNLKNLSRGLVFKNVADLHPGRSVHDLSYSKLFTADMGYLYIAQCDEVVPGDVWTQSVEAVCRMFPLVAPVLHQIELKFESFFVPYRLLWDGWEDYITGGPDGEDDSEIPTWAGTSATSDYGSIWENMGFPLQIDISDDFEPIAFPRTAYNLIYNQYYRDNTLQTEIALDNEELLLRNWEKDYFTSALPFQQRGIAPSLPISGIIDTSAVWAINDFGWDAGSFPIHVYDHLQDGFLINDTNGQTNAFNTFNKNTVSVDLSGATTFNVSDLRLAFQIQKWMERNARVGARYVEWLKGRFGVSPRDDRLQRAEIIGSFKAPIIISEVLQTSNNSADNGPQGSMAGHGITVADGFLGKYHAQEFGLIMTLVSIMPKPMYNSEGINRQWIKQTRYDFYQPEFANLSEQAIYAGEIWAQGTGNDAVFGFQGRWDEMRYKPNIVTGLLRDTLNYWHLARDFSSLPELNSDFIECNARKDIFAVQNEPGFILHIGNNIKAIRPIPALNEPGMIDHS